jgi:hypothetical protein
MNLLHKGIDRYLSISSTGFGSGVPSSLKSSNPQHPITGSEPYIRRRLMER